MPDDGRGLHPNSRANLAKGSAAARGKPRRKPTRPKHRADLIKRLEAAGWKGSSETLDFELFAAAKYDMDHMATAGAERSRLRHDLMILADRLRLGAKATPTKAPPVTPDRSPERMAKVARLLARCGAWGPEAMQMALLGDQVDAIEIDDETEHE